MSVAVPCCALSKRFFLLKLHVHTEVGRGYALEMSGIHCWCVDPESIYIFIRSCRTTRSPSPNLKFNVIWSTRGFLHSTFDQVCVLMYVSIGRRPALTFEIRASLFANGSLMHEDINSIWLNPRCTTAWDQRSCPSCPCVSGPSTQLTFIHCVRSHHDKLVPLILSIRTAVRAKSIAFRGLYGNKLFPSLCCPKLYFCPWLWSLSAGIGVCLTSLSEF